MLDIQTGDAIGLVVETRCTYFMPLAFPQDVEVGLTVAGLSRSTIRYRIGIFGAGADFASAEGEFVHVVVDRASRRPAEIPADWRAKLEAISYPKPDTSPPLIGRRGGRYTPPPGGLGRRRRCPGPSPRCRAMPWTCSIPRSRTSSCRGFPPQGRRDRGRH